MYCAIMCATIMLCACSISYFYGYDSNTHIQARASSIPDVLFLGAADILQCLLGHKASLRPTVPLGRDLSATIHTTLSVGLPE